MESIEPFDLVVFLGLFAMFIVGYAQGIVRRLLGIGAILFSLGLAAQLRNSVGGYLAEQWNQFPDEYAKMLGFGIVFVDFPTQRRIPKRSALWYRDRIAAANGKE